MTNRHCGWEVWLVYSMHVFIFGQFLKVFAKNVHQASYAQFFGEIISRAKALDLLHWKILQNIPGSRQRLLGSHKKIFTLESTRTGKPQTTSHHWRLPTPRTIHNDISSYYTYILQCNAVKDEERVIGSRTLWQILMLDLDPFLVIFNNSGSDEPHGSYWVMV